MLEKHKLISNALAMLINRLTQSIATFVLSSAIARLLGPYDLGEYLLAFTYYFIFATLASQGLKSLFTRNLARNLEDTPTYFVNGTFLQLLLSLVAYVVLVTIVFLMPYSGDTSMVCYIVGLAVVPFSLSNITEAIFQAQEKMHWIAVTTTPIYILRLFIMLAVMHFKFGINFVAAIFVISEVLIFLIQLICILSFVKVKWMINRDVLYDILREGRIFFALDGVTVIGTRSEVIILSIFGGEITVGFYSGVVQLLQPFLIISNSVVLAMFPAMSKATNQGRHEQKCITENLIEILMLMALPFMVGILFMGHDLLTLVYGASFAPAARALQISALGLILIPFSRALSYLLVASGFEKVNLREVLVTTPIRGLMGIILISQFQLLGAVASDLATTVSGSSQYIYATYHRLFSLNLKRIFARPLLVSLLMVPLFWMLKQSNFAVWIVLLIATVVYGVLVGAIGVFALGGSRLIYAKLLDRG